MEIATVLNAHSNPDLIIDTLNSISTYSSKKIVLILDGAAKDEVKKVDYGVNTMIGYTHGVPKAPYKNMALGLKVLRETYPESDWYCYTESDCLWGSDAFKHSLEEAKKQNIWMMGACGRVDYQTMPLIEGLIGERFRSVYYLIGACMFFSQAYMQKLDDLDFFNKFIALTSGFEAGEFPKFNGYDISEHMYPTMARHFGGNIGVFSTYFEGAWHGNYKKYPIRWKPDLDVSEGEDFMDASILHPLKSLDNDIRIRHREKRNAI